MTLSKCFIWLILLAGAASKRASEHGIKKTSTISIIKNLNEEKVVIQRHFAQPCEYHGLRRISENTDDDDDNSEIYYDDTLKEIEYKAEATLWDMFANPMAQWTPLEWFFFIMMSFAFGCIFFTFCCCVVLPRCCSRRTVDIYSASLLV